MQVAEHRVPPCAPTTVSDQQNSQNVRSKSQRKLLEESCLNRLITVVKSDRDSEGPYFRMMRAEITAAMDRIDAVEARGLLSAASLSPFQARDDGNGLSLKRLKPYFERGSGKGNPSKKAAQCGQENVQPAPPFVRPKKSSKSKSLTMQLEASRCKQAPQNEIAAGIPMSAAPDQSRLYTTPTLSNSNFLLSGSHQQLAFTSHLYSQLLSQQLFGPNPMHHLKSQLPHTAIVDSMRPIINRPCLVGSLPFLDIYPVQLAEIAWLCLPPTHESSLTVSSCCKPITDGRACFVEGR